MEDSCFKDDLIDEREAVMVAGGNTTPRKAYFLKPTLTQDHHHHFVSPSPNILLSSNPTFNELKKSYLISWKAHPSEKWKIWVHSLKPKYQKIWRKAGIFEAILTSTHKVERDKDLVICLAERWCADTNTFVFPWGEVTISLQDIIVLGGYSVFGLPYSSPLPANLCDVLDGMKKAHRELKLSCGRNYLSSYVWMDYFMCSGKKFEHEAFLAFWLTRFVFARSCNIMAVQDFDLAVHLSRGTRIALAPLVLASIYHDMTLLRKLMLVQQSQLERIGRVRFVCHIELVQMWAWERFPKLSPPPVILSIGEPRSARWSGVMKLQVVDVRAALDSAEMSFVWRPYAVTSGGSIFHKVYTDKEQWLMLESDANVEIESLVRCLRASELVGLESVEQYLPHRVSRQFGLDQDIPSHVIRSNESRQSAWRNYDRSVRGVKLYIPPRLVKPDVSCRYMDWWKGYVFSDKSGNGCIQNENHIANGDAKTSSTPGFPSESVKKISEVCVDEDNLTIAQLLTRKRNNGSSKETKGADDEPVLSDGLLTGCCRTAKESKPTNESAELSASSSSKSNKRKLTTGCTTEQEETTVVIEGNHPDESNIEIVKESNKGKSSTGCTKVQEEVAVVSQDNHPDESNVEIEKEGFGNTTEKQLEAEGCAVASKAKCPEADIINIDDDDILDDTALELLHSGLEARISRLEKIIGAYKAAKFGAKS